MKMIKAARSAVRHRTSAVVMGAFPPQALKANLLLVGGDAEVKQALRVLDPIMRQPKLSAKASALALPPRFDGTLVLLGAEELDVNDQQRLLEWLAETTRPPQVITTCARPLFPLVQGGAFMTALYYRLNVVTVILQAGTDLRTLDIQTAEGPRAARMTTAYASPLSSTPMRTPS